MGSPGSGSGVSTFDVLLVFSAFPAAMMTRATFPVLMSLIPSQVRSYLLSSEICSISMVGAFFISSLPMNRSVFNFLLFWMTK